MGIARRSFLQGASQLLALLAAGSWGRTPRTAIAQTVGSELPASGSRKLALLVGLNRYPSGAFLRGSLTDVDRQYELLVSRFGFAPADIVTLTDGDATRERIEAAFGEHLIAQAAPGDRVLVHFSGFGRRVRVGDGEQESLLVAPNGGDRDVLVSTLQLLLQSLATPHAALVLDTSFSGSDRALLGNLRSRTFPGARGEMVAGAELAFQNSFRGDRVWSEDAEAGRQNSLLLKASAPEQPAVEGDWGGFQAGLFTYALTQALWQAKPARQLWFDLALACQQVAAWTGGQQQPGTTGASRDYAGELAAAAAVGRIVSIEREGAIVIRLTGLPLSVLRGYALNSCLLVNGVDNPSRLQVYAREGLTVRARLTAGDMPTPGQTVSEAIRVLPYNPGLIVACDGSFDRIERVDATSAFANIPSVPTPGVAGEGVADCVFGRSPSGGYSLQWPNGTPIAATIGPNNEAIKSAVGRLTGYLNTLLAAKLWRMLANVGSTQLRASASLETSYPEVATLQQQSTVGTGETAKGSLARTIAGNEIHYRLENHGDLPLYFVVLGLDAAGNAIAFTPPFSAEPQIAPRSARVLPEPAASYDWIVAGPAGIAEIYVFFSTAPLKRTWEAIASGATARGEGERVVTVNVPLTVAQALQEDLRGASAVSGETFGYDPAVFALDPNHWAAFDFVYRVETP